MGGINKEYAENFNHTYLEWNCPEVRESDSGNIASLSEVNLKSKNILKPREGSDLLIEKPWLASYLEQDKPSVAKE